MPTVLMVAEKPMLAQAIANILSGGRMSSRKGFNGACSVHEYDSNFLGRVAHFKFTSTCGHVMGLDFLPKYNNWEKVDPVELYEADTQKKEANPKLRMNDFLASEAKGIDYLVLWLDCDKEGENICFEVYDAVQHVMKKPYGNEQTVFRAHFSAITAKDIHQAMKTLGAPNENEALSVDARQELDLRIGCAFTRFQTKFFHQKYGDLDSSLISFGPCQTPTLGFCVTRYDLIQGFKPESYWVMQTTLKTLTKSSTAADEIELKPEWNRGRIFDRDVCQFFLDKVKSNKQATVIDLTSEERSKAKPIALNTVELMRVGSSGLGMGPSHTMSIAEQLYTQGYTSYPRTETTQYPENFDLLGVVRDQTSSRIWGEEAKAILSKGIKKPKKGNDAGDHPPITPMKADDGRLSGDQLRVYEYIVRHFLATVSEDCKYLLATARFKIGDEEFSMSGKTVISPGFTAVLTWQAVDNDEKMPNLIKNEKLDLIDAKIIERQTSPPDYLTESELITLMEKHGIGTDASIPVHINNICQRNYVTVTGTGRRLVPTSLGIVLVHGYWKIDPDLVQPKMRSAVEEQLNLIAKGRAKYKSVTEHALKIFRMKFEYFVLNIGQMDELFEVSFTTLSESGKPFTRCGICRRYMKLISARPTRLHCGTCQQTYSLPQGRDAVLRPYSDQKCPLDDFELMYWFGGGRSKGFTICPYCYNNPPFPGMVKHQGCNECLHPACRHSFNSLGVSPCPRCANGVGVLVIDPGSGPPKWKLTCNKCPLILFFCDGALKVKSTDKSCADCESQLINVEYKPGKSLLPSKQDSYTGCLFCDEELKGQVDLSQLQLADSAAFRGSRGFGGRGRGGRGRGRGRGRGGRGRGRRGRGGSGP